MRQSKRDLSKRSLMITNMLVLLVLFVSAVLGAAQSSSSRIAGTVRDSSGAIVPEASVKVTNNATGVSWNTRTNGSGEYIFPSLPAGDYSVNVTHSGFETTAINHAQLEVLQTASIDVVLKAGAVSETVTVEDTPTLMQMQTSDLGSVITAEQIEAIPLNGRDILQLATLSPGVNTFYSTQAAPTRGAQSFQGANFLGGTQNVGTTITVSVSREYSSQYRIDGINITNPLVGQITVMPSPDDIQEFKTEIGTAPAAFSSPQSINMITKGGANVFHGALYDYLRNDALDTKNYFLQTGQKAPLRFNQFGTTMSGPIVHNRAFFFLGYEGLRSHMPAIVFADVPTDSMLGGNFDYSGAPTIYDYNAADPSASTPFPNNTIPSNRISSFATAFNQFLPHQNFTGSGALSVYNFRTTLNNPYDNDQGTGRVDFALSDRDRMYGRYTYSTSYNDSPGIMPLYGLRYPYSGSNLAVEETHTFNQNLLNVARFGYTTSSLSVTQEGAYGTNYVSELGLQNLAGGTDPQQFGLPTVIITDLGATYGPPNGSSPRGGDWKLWEATDQLTWLRKNHTFQAGLDFQHNNYNVTNPTASRGFFEFLPYFTGEGGTNGGIGLADYLLGLPVFALGDNGDSYQELHWTDYELYVQDDWRVRKNLTLNLGLRYSYATAPEDLLNKQSYFDFSCPCVVTADSGKISNGIYTMPKNNFAPRIGAAWDPYGNNKTAVRAAYGIYYTIDEQAGSNFVRNNPPYYGFQFITNTPNPVPITSLFPPATGPTPATFFLFTVDPHQKTEAYQQWNLSVQQELQRDLSLQISYVGGHGTHLARRVNANQAVLGTTPIQSRRPLPQFGDILAQINVSSSNYDALQASLTKTMRNGFTITSSYAYANGFDYATDPGSANQNRLDPKAEYGPSDFLVKNRFVFSGIWDLPMGRGHYLRSGSSWGDQLLGGWQISSIVLLQGGTPLTITSNNLTDTGGFINTRANTTCNGNLPKSQRTLTEFFNTSCFSQPPNNTFGNSRRGSITGPGLNNTDLNFRKTTELAGKVNLRFDAQFFNIFNHPQFNAPDTGVSDPSFGRVASALAGRNVQLSLKLLY